MRHVHRYLRYLRNPRLSLLALRDSAQQRNKPTAAIHFELTKNRVEVLFHHRQTQASVICDLLVAVSFAHKSRNFLLRLHRFHWACPRRGDAKS
jgi:hypothetical protein